MQQVRGRNQSVKLIYCAAKNIMHVTESSMWQNPEARTSLPTSIILDGELPVNVKVREINYSHIYTLHDMTVTIVEVSEYQKSNSVMRVFISVW